MDRQVEALLAEYPQLRRLADEHRREVAAAFTTLVPEYFLTRLGPDFLSRTYWQVFCRDPRCFGFVWIVDDRVVGFVTGTDEREGFLGRVVVQAPMLFAARLLLTSLRSVGFIKQGVGLIGALRAERQRRDPKAELMSLGVLPRELRPVRGADGQLQSPAVVLMAAANAWLRARGVARYRLYTGASNRLACAFYRRLELSESHRLRVFGEEKICFVGETSAI